MTQKDATIRIEKLLRRERGERLFLAAASGGRRALVLQVASSAQGAQSRLEDVGQRLARAAGPGIPELLEWQLKQNGLLQLAALEPSGVFLADLLGEETASPALAVSFWEALLKSLEPLHEQNLVYGLCHPQRLMVDRKTRVLLPEAGLVPALADHLGEGMPSAGSLFQRLFAWPELVPPELLRSDPLTPAADVYQSAALVYRLMTGRSPYGDGLSVEIYNRMLRQQIEPLDQFAPDVPRILTTLMAQCLNPDPDKRPPNALRLRHQLGELALARDPLAEPVLKQVEQPYSSRYPGLLAIHEGLDESAVELNADKDLVSVADVEKEVLLGQLERLRTQRQSEAPSTRWITWATLGLFLVLGVLAIPYLLDLGQSTPKQHEGRLPADSDGRTHRELTWERGDSTPHPTIRSLVASVSVVLRRRLEAAGIPIDAQLEFVPPILPPYRLRTVDTTPAVVFEFTARNRLRSIRISGEAERGEIEFIILYDAEGAPRSIAKFGPGKRFLRYLGVGAQKDADSPRE